MDQSADLIQNKIQFMQADLELTKTFLSMAGTERDLNNHEHFERLKGNIREALETMNRMLRDSRIPVPEAEAAQLSNQIAACQTAYDAL
jgi:hypothetical protein